MDRAVFRRVEKMPSVLELGESDGVALCPPLTGAPITERYNKTLVKVYNAAARRERIKLTMTDSKDSDGRKSGCRMLVV